MEDAGGEGQGKEKVSKRDMVSCEDLAQGFRFQDVGADCNAS